MLVLRPKRSVPLITALLALAVASVASCGRLFGRKSEQGGGGAVPSVPGPPLQQTGVIMGSVNDPNGVAVGDVTVTTGGQTVKTNPEGYFVVNDVSPTDRQIVTFKKAGFAMTSQITQVRAGEGSFLAAAMLQEYPANPLGAAAGGEAAAPNGAAVGIKPGTLVDASGNAYSGPVQVGLTSLDSMDPVAQQAIAGSFDGAASYGVVDVEVRDGNGQPLALAPGQTATITIPIPAALKDGAPATAPLASYSESDGQWHEEGALTRDGDVYRGDISHFALWNGDQPFATCKRKGRAVDCASGAPLRGAKVTCRGHELASRADDPSTGDDGTFGLVSIAGDEVDCWASKNGVDGEHKGFAACSKDATVDMGDLCVQAPRIKITLTWGAAPSDLDANLTLPPPPGGERPHVSVANRTSGSTSLDTDAATGFGPEIMTVAKLDDGTYRYSVHHFAGDGNIANSGATVNMLVDGVGIYRMKAPPAAAQANDLWRVWDIRAQGGKVVEVKLVNDVVHMPDAAKEASYSP